MLKITTHSLIKNEDNWIWYSLNSVKDFAAKMLVVDDASTDHTVEIVKSISDPKIVLTSVILSSASEHTAMRNQMIKQTTTEWFLILDGDEIWDRKTLTSFTNFLESVPKSVAAVALRTRNCVGDVFHYMPENAGKYKILGREGHLATRAYRKLPGYSWQGEYPLEKFADKNGVDIANDPNRLAFFDGFYWHTTHLKRSSSDDKVKGWRTKKNELGIPVKSETEFPEVFNWPHPAFVPSPFKKRTVSDTIIASVITPIKYFRRKFHE